MDMARRLVSARSSGGQHHHPGIVAVGSMVGNGPVQGPRQGREDRDVPTILQEVQGAEGRCRT